MKGSPERGNPHDPSNLADAEDQGGFRESALLPARRETSGETVGLSRGSKSYDQSPQLGKPKAADFAHVERGETGQNPPSLPLCSYMELKDRQAGAEPDALAAEVEGEVDESAKLPARVTRYGKARRHAKETFAHILSFLRDDGGCYDSDALGVLGEAAEKLKACGNWLHFRDYFTVGKVRLHAAHFCQQSLLCEFCAIRRGAKALGAYIERFHAIKAENPAIQNSMITFTIKNGPDLLERFDHIQDAIKGLRKRRTRAKTGSRDKTEWSKVLGWVGGYEIKRGENSQEWHVHVHVEVLHVEWISAQALKDEWQMITGDSHVLRIDPAKHPDAPERDFLEVFKYAVKFNEMSLDDRLEAFLKLSGRRLLFSGGLFRTVKVPKDLHEEPLEGLPFVDLFYAYSDERCTYSLEACRDQHGHTTYVNPGTSTAEHASVVFRDGDMKSKAIQNKPGITRSEAKAVVDLARHVATGERPEGWNDEKWKAYLAEYKKRATKRPRKIQMDMIKLDLLGELHVSDEEGKRPP